MILVLFAAVLLVAFLVPLVVWNVSERRRSRIRNSIIESGRVIGARVSIASPIGRRARAEIGGQRWYVHEEGGAGLEGGQEVTVLGVAGTTLIVRASPENSGSAAP